MLLTLMPLCRVFSLLIRCRYLLMLPLLTPLPMPACHIFMIAAIYLMLMFSLDALRQLAL